MLVSRRHFFFGSLALPALAAKKPAPERPNFLLVVVDGLPAWVLGCYGNKEILTPNLDRLAATGTRFLNHIACTPAPDLSRATLLSGRTPMQFHDAESPSAPEAPLFKVLGDAGYGTHAGDLAGAAQSLDQQSAAKPFFLIARHTGPQPSGQAIDAKYGNLYAQTAFNSLDLQRTAAPTARAGKEMFSDVVGNVRKYAAAVSALDAEVGALVQKLSQRRLLDTTMVIVISTSGALLGRHGLWGTGDASDPPNMYEESVTTPLLCSWPGHVPAMAMRPELVSTYDFVPTLCDLLAIDPPAGNLCGRSYLLRAEGKPLPKKQRDVTMVFGHLRTTEMARGDRYKLIVHSGGPGELYDLRQDPGEKANQYENQQYASVRSTLSDGLANWKRLYST